MVVRGVVLWMLGSSGAFQGWMLYLWMGLIGTVVWVVVMLRRVYSLFYAFDSFLGVDSLEESSTFFYSMDRYV